MVARWAHGAKGVFQFARHHGIGGSHGRTGSAQRCRPGVHVDGSVGIDLRELGTAGLPLFSQQLRIAAQDRHMRAVMCQLNVGQRGQGSLEMLQRIEHTRHQQAVLDGSKALGTLWMSWAHLVLPAISVGVIAGFAHSCASIHLLWGNVMPCKHSTKSSLFWISLTR